MVYFKTTVNRVKLDGNMTEIVLLDVSYDLNIIWGAKYWNIVGTFTQEIDYRA